MLFWINKGRYKNIYCRLSQNKCRVEISTGLHITPGKWKGHYVRANGSSEESLIVNQRLSLIQNKLNYILLKLEEEGHQNVTPQLVKDIYVNKSDVVKNVTSLSEAFKQAINIKKKKRGAAPTTVKAYNTVTSDFKAFLKTKNLSDIYAHTVDKSLTEEYMEYCRGNGDKFSTVNKKKGQLRTLFYVIIDDLTCLKPAVNPFKFTLNKTKEEAETPENKQKWLDPDVQAKLENAELDTRLDYYRRMFLFQIYSGLAFIDMIKFNPDIHIVKDAHDNSKWIHLRRTKTVKHNIYGRVPIKKKLGNIIESLAADQEDPLLINDEASYDNYMKGLKQMSELLNIPKITSHMGRHTFGCRMLEAGVPMITVARMMGHKKISTTEEIYAMVTSEKLKNDVNNADIE